MTSRKSNGTTIQLAQKEAIRVIKQFSGTEFSKLSIKDKDALLLAVLQLLGIASDSGTIK